MKNKLILLYMFFAHPILFWKYSIRPESKYFLANGMNQSIKNGPLLFGKKVRFGNYTRVNFYGNGKLSFGDGCYIGQRNSFLVGDNITIENGVLMASDICIISENHAMDPLSEIGYGGQPLIIAPVTIKEGCWIGEKVVILPGITIGKKSIIGAGSIVTRSVPDYCVAVGNPARVVKTFDFVENKWKSA
ncbi:TPA: acyltransferase [Streptococcus suis]|nr:acyltransferase [Streptococcus suis]